MLMRASKLVSAVTAFPVQYNKAIVGKNAFAHESGIHQDGMLKNAQTYEIMRPEDVGVKSTSLVMGKHSGRHAFREKLKELGYELGDNALEDAFRRFKDLADRKKHVFDEDIVGAGRGRDRRQPSEAITAGRADRHRRHRRPAEGDRHARRRRPRTRPARRPATARSTRSSTRSARSSRTRRRCCSTRSHAVTEGTDAQAEVSVRLEEERQDRHRPRRRHRHDGRLGQGLCLGAQQARHAAREGKPEALKAI